MDHPTAGNRPVPGHLADRRRFLGLASACCLGLGASTRALAGAFKPIDIGTLADFPDEGICEKHVSHNFFVVRRGGRLFAVIATCPHKGNFLLRDPQDATRIICSGHDSVFDPEGRPLNGPVRQGLARFAISMDADGRILVDPGRPFPQARWDDRASFIPLAAPPRPDPPAPDPAP